jgi:hypothetical protein
VTTRIELAGWIEAYEAAWRTAGTGPLAELFTCEATYRPEPFADALVGLEAIATFWEAERDGPHEVFAMTSEIVAVDGDVGVARVEVAYGNPATTTYRDLWIVALDIDRRCTAFEEWPFFPGRRRVASQVHAVADPG